MQLHSMDDEELAEAWTAVSKRKQGAAQKLARQPSAEEAFTAAAVARMRAAKATALRQGQRAKEDKDKVEARVEARAIARGGLVAYQSARPVADRGAHVAPVGGGVGESAAPGDATAASGLVDDVDAVHHRLSVAFGEAQVRGLS